MGKFPDNTVNIATFPTIMFFSLPKNKMVLLQMTEFPVMVIRLLTHFSRHAHRLRAVPERG